MACQKILYVNLTYKRKWNRSNKCIMHYASNIRLINITNIHSKCNKLYIKNWSTCTTLFLLLLGQSNSRLDGLLNIEILGLWSQKISYHLTFTHCFLSSAVCLPRNYSSMDIPLIDEPNKIAIEIHISDVLKINDRDFSITFSLYFNVRWIEPRLRLNPTFFQNR